MQVYINRAKALLLVGTISAGCASSNDDEGPDNPGAAGTAGAAGNGGTSSAGGSGQGGAGAGTGGTPSIGGSGQGGGGTGGAPSAGGSGQSDPDAGDPDAGSPDAGSPDAGGLDAGGLDEPDAGGDGGTLTCDDSADTVVSCDGLEQTECSGLEGFLSSECEMIAFIMKPAPANLARNCMIALEPPELCVTTSTHLCILGGLESACPDPEADDECTVIAAACGDSLPDFSACTSALSGMTQSGRDQMVQCMTAPCDLFACIEGLTLN